MGTPIPMTISVNIVDREVWMDVSKLIRNPDLLSQHIKAMRTPDPTEDHRVPIAEKKKKVEEEIENIIELGKNATSEIGRKKLPDFCSSQKKNYKF